MAMMRRLLAVRESIPLSSDQRKLFSNQFHKRFVLSSARSGNTDMLKFLLWASSLTADSAEEYVLWLGQRAIN